MTGAVDIWVNPFTEEATQKMSNSAIQDISTLVGDESLYSGAGQSPEEFIERMDAANVDVALVPSLKFDGENNSRDGVQFSEETIISIYSDFPDRLKGLVGINPYDGMGGVERLEEYVEDHGFVGAHIVPHGFHLPTNHRRYYPYYAKCVELDIPVIIQIGHTAVQMPNDPGRPKYIDDIALEFPELDIIGANIGWPWSTEMMALAWTHPNVYIATTGHAPQYWETEFIDFIRGRGQNKVMWGTSYPTINLQDTIQQVSDLNLNEVSERKLLSVNARSVFGI